MDASLKDAKTMTMSLRDPAPMTIPTRTAASKSPDQRESLLGQLYAAAAFTVVFLILLCGVYPAVVWGIGQTIFPIHANGSLIRKDGTYTTKDEEAVGSALLGQSFAAPGYFHPRPSAAGGGYDAASSGGTNLGPLSDKLLNGIHGSQNADGTPNPSADYDGVKDLAIAYRKENSLAGDAIVPADAVTRSASGLDPHISVENARIQATRVAKARGMNAESMQKLIDEHTDSPSLGVLGDAGVRVLKLNLALDKVAPISALTVINAPTSTAH